RVEPDAQGMWGLTARFETSAPTGDEDQFAGERSAVFIPSAVLDWRLKRAFAAAELGARIRPVAELVGARVGTQMAVGLGGGYDLLKKRELLSVLAEVRALPTLTEQHDSKQTNAGLESVANGKMIVPAEWSIGARTAPLAGGDFVIHAGGGGPISTDPPLTTPRLPFLPSVPYPPLPPGTGGDGVLHPRHPGPPHHAPVPAP